MFLLCAEPLSKTWWCGIWYSVRAEIPSPCKVDPSGGAEVNLIDGIGLMDWCWNWTIGRLRLERARLRMGYLVFWRFFVFGCDFSFRFVSFGEVCESWWKSVMPDGKYGSWNWGALVIQIWRFEIFDYMAKYEISIGKNLISFICFFDFFFIFIRYFWTFAFLLLCPSTPLHLFAYFFIRIGQSWGILG